VATVPIREKEEMPMPHYVCLFNWTEQGITNVKETLHRVDSAFELGVSKYGVGLEKIYWTLGAHDLVAILEAPDDESVSALLLELASEGNVRSTTLRAFDSGEMSRILGRLG
jgi:uncharacterized protein with GYD domain